jgi:hypothetical protein
LLVRVTGTHDADTIAGMVVAQVLALRNACERRRGANVDDMLADAGVGLVNALGLCVDDPAAALERIEPGELARVVSMAHPALRTFEGHLRGVEDAARAVARVQGEQRDDADAEHDDAPELFDEATGPMPAPQSVGDLLPSGTGAADKARMQGGAS